MLLAVLCAQALPAVGADAASADAVGGVEQARAALAAARATHVDALAPRTFEDAADAFESAARDLARGRDAARIEASLAAAEAALAEATRRAAAVRAALPELAQALEDAKRADAHRLAPATWARAATRLNETAVRAERDDVDGARKRATEAISLLRGSELEAIQASLLTSARRLIREAEAADVGDFAPRTLADAKRLAAQAAEEVVRNRYETAVPADLAANAEYQARHAMLLATQIRRLQESRREDYALEALMLEWEAPLARLAVELGMTPRFDQGYLRPLDAMQKQLAQTRVEVEQLRATLAARDAELADLRATAASSAVVAAPTLPAAAPAAAASPDASAATPIEALFAPDEATITRRDGNVIITLTSLRFADGQSALDAAGTPVLAKLRDAVKRFADADILIEGHTSDSGDAEADRALSQDRANAVRQFLLLVSSLPQERVTSMGYGTSRPLAPADSAQGRQRNQRVDVVIRGAASP